jgi:hypothetical protein
VSKTTPTLQVVVNPFLRQKSPIHQSTFRYLKSLGANYVRFVPWFPYPHMAVAELKPPEKGSTFWDFSQIDPIINDFMKATKDHSVVLNFSTIPAWMFKTDHPVNFPSNADQVAWDYNQGSELRDSTLKELTDYYMRLLSWYTRGGFTDENGKFHHSGHEYKIQYWEVFNEPDLEHSPSIKLYTKMYDAMVTAMRKIAPATKFIGLSLAFESNPDWFEYFLNPSNHQPGIPLDGISYHFYGTPDADSLSIDNYQYSFFDKAEGFLDKVRYIEGIRKRLSPQTITTINEVGTILGDSYTSAIPDKYWNLSGAMFGYVYLQLVKMGIEVVGESQLVGYPTQYPDVSMMDWRNGLPNARYWTLKLLLDNFGPGDQLVETHSPSADVSVQGFVTKKGKKILLINKKNRQILLELPSECKGGRMDYVDPSTHENPPASMLLEDSRITLAPFGVAVVTLVN